MLITRIKFILFILILLATLEDSSAQSPYRMSWIKEGIISATAIGIIAIGESSVDNNTTPTQEDIIAQMAKRNEINSIDRSVTNNYSKTTAGVSSGLTIALVLSPFALHGSSEISNDFWTVTGIYFETMFLSYGVINTLKANGLRYRPLTYNPNVSMEDKLDLGKDLRWSFPSGDATLSFTSAVFFATVYNDYFPESKWTPYVWGGALGVAATVAVMRTQAGAHFPTDVLTGAAIGSLIGWGIPYLHRTDGKGYSLTPYVIPGEYSGLSLTYKL